MLTDAAERLVTMSPLQFPVSPASNRICASKQLCLQTDRDFAKMERSETWAIKGAAMRILAVVALVSPLLFPTVWAGAAARSATGNFDFLLANQPQKQGNPEEKEISEPLQPEIVKAWRDAGAEMGWMKDAPPRLGSYHFWEPWREKNTKGAIPAFRFPQKDAEGVFDKLPEPGTAFGLDFHCGFYAGVTLKQLAKLKNLHSLCIGGVQGNPYGDLKELAGMTQLRHLYLFYLPVTDAQLKHLSGFKKLQVLDLSNTSLTDAGLDELAGLKSLQWLNLHDTEVTSEGVAALQKELPKCKILSGSK